MPFASRIEDHHHVLRPWSRQSETIAASFVRGEGSWLTDDRETSYLDFSSGWVCANLGHGHPQVLEAVHRQLDRLCYAPASFANDTRSELARALSDLSPWAEGARVHFTTGGGEAADDAFKIARMMTGRPRVLSAHRSYHGTVAGAAALTGDRRRRPSEPGIPGVVRFFAPFPYRSPFGAGDAETERARALAHLEAVIEAEGADRIAALFIEPVVGSNGVIVYPEGYLDDLRRLTEAHGILLVFDEVMTGFGRVGAAFAATRFGVSPDMILFAKGVNSAYLPLGGVMLRKGLASFFDHHLFDFGHTHSGHPLACASGLGALAAYRSCRAFAQAMTIERWAKDAFAELSARHRIIGDVRGLGAFWGLELVADRDSKVPLSPWHEPLSSRMQRIRARLLAERVLTYGRHNILMVAPPLTISREDWDFGIEALHRALSDGASV